MNKKYFSFLFFQVYLVKSNQSYYALKTLRKNHVLEGQNWNYIKSELEILIECQTNPFIIQLINAFQNSERLFFLMEIARAGTLFELLENQCPRSFKYEQIIFFTGEISVALKYLHLKKIVRNKLFY